MTLLEMLVVVAIIAAMAGVAYVPVTAGLDTLRLNSAATSVAAMFTDALSHADRKQQVVEISISAKDRSLRAQSTGRGYERKIELPQGVTIRSIAPAPEHVEEGPRVFYLYPGGAVPRIGVEMANSRNNRRLVRIDPITGVPQITRLEN